MLLNQVFSSVGLYMITQQRLQGHCMVGSALSLIKSIVKVVTLFFSLKLHFLESWHSISFSLSLTTTEKLKHLSVKAENNTYGFKIKDKQSPGCVLYLDSKTLLSRAWTNHNLSNCNADLTIDSTEQLGKALCLHLLLAEPKGRGWSEG